MDNIELDIRRFNLIQQGTVVGWDGTGVTVQRSGSSEICIRWKEVKGILLTEKILVANGFKKVDVTGIDNAYYYELYIGGGLKIVSSDTVYNEGKDEWCIGVKFENVHGTFNNGELNCVHHLQNLYFDLKRKPL